MSGALQPASRKRKITHHHDKEELQKFIGEKVIKKGSITKGLLFLTCLPYFALGYTGQCLMPDGGTNTLSADIGAFNIDDSSSNVPGKIIVKDFPFFASGLPYRASCDNDKSALTPIFLTTKVPLSRSGKDDGWYRINDYLSVKSQTWIDAGREAYIDNPMEHESNEYNEQNGTETNWRTGGKGRVSIRIDRPFIGMSPFKKEILEIYANTFKEGISTKPLTVLYLSGNILVPQGCELNAGQVISMDFGNIGSSAFSQAGAGKKPAGVNPQTRSIGIQCKNIDAQTLLSLRIEANNVSGNSIVSDNPDLGFVVGDGKQNPLTPNNVDSKIPFRLNNNAAATVPISAWPVSVTGNKPAEGRFTSEGYLRVDFD
jgi:minor fimbrial subunit